MNQHFNTFHRVWNPFPEYWSNPWEYFTHAITILKSRGACFITMSEAYAGKFDPANINIILDHHIDHYPVEMEVMSRWELEQGIVSSIYLFAKVSSSHIHQKIHQWSVEDLNIDHYQALEEVGFEIGYHHNAVGRAVLELEGKDYQFSRTTEARKLDLAVRVRASEIFKQDVEYLRRYFNIRTFIPHGGGEGNAFLDEAQTLCENLIWAYNNRPTDQPSWQNFTDSSGLDAKIFKIDAAQIVATRESLLAKAMTAEPGLHHILLHPGRFSQGMPIERYTYADKLPRYRPVQVSVTYPADQSYLPLNIANLVRQWSVPLQENFTDLKSKHYSRILTDSPSCLRRCMGVTENCIGYLLHYDKLNRKMKRRFQRKEKLHKSENKQYLSFPIFSEIGPDSLQKVNELFLQEFLFAYNQVFSNKPWHFLLKNNIKWDLIHLEKIKFENNKDVDYLIQFIDKLAPQTQVQLTLSSLNSLVNLKKIINLQLQLEKIDHLNCSLTHSQSSSSPGWTLYIERENLNSIDSDNNQFASIDLSSRFRLVDQYFFSVPYSQKALKSTQDLKHESSPRAEDISSDQGTLINQRPIMPKVDAYLALSHQLFCRPISCKSFQEFSNLCVSEEIFKGVTQSPFNKYQYHPFGNIAYRTLIQAPPNSDLLYQYLKQGIIQALIIASKNISRRAQILAWKWSYAARSSLEAYTRLNEPRFLALILDSYDIIRQWRDSAKEIVDECRGQVCPSWGSDFYDQYAESKNYDLSKEDSKSRWTCTSATAGRITFPVVVACLTALSRSEKSRSDREYHIIFQEAAEALRMFISDLTELNENCSAMWREDRGCYEPLNHQNAWAEAALVTSKALGDEQLYKSAIKVMSTFKAELNVDPLEAYIWPYRGQYDQAMRKRSHEVEDIAHAYINIAAAHIFHQYSSIFSQEDMQRFCNTFLYHVYQDRYSFSPRVNSKISPEINIMKSHYAAHFICWSVLASYNADILNIIEQTIAVRYDLYPDNWFSSIIGSYAYACRFEPVI